MKLFKTKRYREFEDTKNRINRDCLAKQLIEKTTIFITKFNNRHVFCNFFVLHILVIKYSIKILKLRSWGREGEVRYNLEFGIFLIFTF